MQELTARTLRRFLTKILKLCNFRFKIQSFYSKNCKFADKKLKTNEFLACTRPRKLLSMSGFTARILRRLRMRILKLFNFRFKICCWTIRIGHRLLKITCTVGKAKRKICVCETRVVGSPKFTIIYEQKSANFWKLYDLNQNLLLNNTFGIC